jgi:SAM-dependent methyltransferase
VIEQEAQANRGHAASQAAYHRQLFAAVYRWDTLWRQTIEMTGDVKAAVDLGLDQMGHFGPRGVSLVIDRLVTAADDALTSVIELGSGVGGALRQTARELRSRGIRALLVGVELVDDHCRISGVIDRSIGETGTRLVEADVECLPFRSESIDAAFAAGSASHFASMPRVLAECRRVLRPRGTLVMTEEVSLRPQTARPPDGVFMTHHPPRVFHTATIDERRAEIDRVGLVVDRVEPLARWAAPLLRQRAQALRFMEGCARRMFGDEPYSQMVETLTSAAQEYERGTIEPVLIVARRKR